MPIPTTLTNRAPDPRLNTDAIAISQATATKSSSYMHWLMLTPQTDTSKPRMEQGMNVDIDDNTGWRNGIDIPSAGDWILAVSLAAPTSVPVQAVVRAVYDGTPASSKPNDALTATPAAKQVVIPFSTHDACTISWCLRSQANGLGFNAGHLIVCARDEWELLQSMGLDYFDYDTLPIPAGGGA